VPAGVGESLLRRHFPADQEHDDLLTWLGLEKPADFDPSRFEVEQANRH
jgi:hypothetical protein